MSSYLYILYGWLLFVAIVYAYMFYDIHAEEIDIRDKWHRLIEAFTEEE